MIVTIHQPNFMPWYPFFQKIQQADIFVLLGHCQFEKNGFQNRFNMDGKWNTMSVKKGLEFINTKQYIDAKKDWERIKNSIPKYKHILSEMDDLISDNLYQTNSSIIRYLVKKLNIDTIIVEDYETDLTSTSRLVDICKRNGATTYLAGQGGKDYLNEELFNIENIQVVYQENMNRIHTLEYLNEISKF
jgi:hypothetical protein